MSLKIIFNFNYCLGKVILIHNFYQALSDKHWYYQCRLDSRIRSKVESVTVENYRNRTFFFTGLLYILNLCLENGNKDYRKLDK